MSCPVVRIAPLVIEFPNVAVSSMPFGNVVGDQFALTFHGPPPVRFHVALVTPHREGARKEVLKQNRRHNRRKILLEKVRVEERCLDVKKENREPSIFSLHNKTL
jgi:hypothetical protein